MTDFTVPNSTVQLVKLKEIVNLILDHLILDVGANSVVIEPAEALYWEVLTPDLYDMQKDPKELGVGSLLDDWDFLLKIEDREGAVGLMLDHAAPLLRYVGETIGR